MIKSVRVRVPGSTANCGPGFDSIGIALSVYNEMELTLLPEKGLEVIIKGAGEGLLPTGEENIVIKAIRLIFERLEKDWQFSLKSRFQGMRIRMNNHIPLSRGLGSSAAAIVAALLAANEVTGSKFSKNDIFTMATAIEGHPDNVAPAIFGGITLSISEGQYLSKAKNNQSHVHCLKFLPAVKFSLVAAIPEFELSTKLARQVLPQSVPLSDAIFNISRTALLVGALCQGELDYLKYALQDKIHQPYREKLIIGMSEVLAAATEAGALGAVLSGSGPCLIAFAENNEDNIGRAMVKAFEKHNVKAGYLILAIDNEGAQVV